MLNGMPWLLMVLRTSKASAIVRSLHYYINIITVGEKQTNKKHRRVNLLLTFKGAFHEQHVYGYIKGGGVVEKSFHALFRQEKIKCY